MKKQNLCVLCEGSVSSVSVKINRFVPLPKQNIRKEIIYFTGINCRIHEPNPLGLRV